MPTVHPLPPLPEIAVRIARLDAHVLRCPIETPVRTSFGTMRDRPAVFVRVEDDDGAVGWGETWCNFPACGAEHRARLLASVIAPLVVGREFASPAAAFDAMTRATAVLALQSGEPGPLAQSIAGVDLALWDLCARKRGEPLWRLLGGGSDRIEVYASGINPDRPEAVVGARRAAGYRAFKLKVGFDAARDLANVAALRALLGADAVLMVDANQGWSLDEALQRLRAFAPFGLGWIEEPLRADRPGAEWATLAAATSIPLAAGENLLGLDAFEEAIDARRYAVVQPDVAKWGGISGCWAVIERVRAAGLRYCPHYLGAGIGLAASGQLLAAVGGDGMLEVDANPNPLRSALCPALESVRDGRVALGAAPGLGIEVDLENLLTLCR
ncbi:MAG: mandelate racemase/muconate lactonizing enzyme family protein [Caldimonas sp.]